MSLRNAVRSAIRGSGVGRSEETTAPFRPSADPRTLAENLTALARRYGKKKKRLFALDDAPVRSPLKGEVGTAGLAQPTSSTS